MEYKKLLEVVYEAAVQCVNKGVGYSQQSVVLDAVWGKFNSNNHFGSPLDIRLQQEILTCWHDLFREGRLSWGLNLDNPDAPFFHVPTRAEK